jgi:hypothetical protein
MLQDTSEKGIVNGRKRTDEQTSKELMNEEVNSPERGQCICCWVGANN